MRREHIIVVVGIIFLLGIVLLVQSNLRIKAETEMKDNIQREIPALDAARPERTEVATFALG